MPNVPSLGRLTDANGQKKKKNIMTYKDSKVQALNKILVSANEMKDRIIMELRSELINKSDKIDELKVRIKSLE